MTHMPPGDMVLTITVDQLHRAFDAWETDYRKNASGFQTAEETASADQTQIVTERVAAFVAYLEAAK